MSRFWEIFCVPLLFRRHVCLSKLKHLRSRESPLTARKTVFSHLKYLDRHKSYRRKTLSCWEYYFLATEKADILNYPQRPKAIEKKNKV